MSDENGTITSGAVNVRVARMPMIGWPMLNSRFTAGLAWVLCSVGSPLTISSGCPTRTPTTRGA